MKSITKAQVLETSLVIAVGFVVLFLVDDFKPFLLIALSVGVIGLFVQPLGKVITWLWLKLAEVLGLFMPKVVLSLIFYLFLVPFATVSRLFSKDPMLLRKKSAEASYWVEREHAYEAEDLQNTW